MTGNQCDNCRKFEAGQCPGWLELRQQVPRTEPTIFGSMDGCVGRTTGNFCTVKCAAEYLYAQVALQDVEPRE